jgi:hypothetical protein
LKVANLCTLNPNSKLIEYELIKIATYKTLAREIEIGIETSMHAQHGPISTQYGNLPN